MNTNIKKMKDQQLVEIRDVLNYELKCREELNDPSLIDFRLAFVIAKDFIEQELFERKQLSLI